MDPHFMFNTLNSIASLVYDQRVDAAVGMIVALSEFLRRALEDSHRAQVTLREEVEYLQRYIDIQKVRFGDRLRIRNADGVLQHRTDEKADKESLIALVTDCATLEADADGLSFLAYSIVAEEITKDSEYQGSRSFGAKLD